MSKVICIANAKGGTGKNTTNFNLGAAIARKGKRVLLMHGNQDILCKTNRLTLNNIRVANMSEWLKGTNQETYTELQIEIKSCKKFQPRWRTGTRLVLLLKQQGN